MYEKNFVWKLYIRDFWLLKVIFANRINSISNEFCVSIGKAHNQKVAGATRKLAIFGAGKRID